MPKGRIYHDHAYPVKTGCGIDRDFKDKKSQEKWVKIHQSRCEICRQALRIDNKNTQEGRMFAMNDEQRMREGYSEVFEIISRV